MAKSPSGTKADMFAIWVVASLLWVGFSTYMFDLSDVQKAYERQAYYEYQYLKGKKRDYYRRAMVRANNRVTQANKNLSLFFLVGFGLPGIMLTIGTCLLEDRSSPKKKKRKTVKKSGKQGKNKK